MTIHMVLQCTSAFVTLTSVDIELLIRFYTNLLGQEPEPHIPNIYAEFHLPCLRLGIFRPKQTHQQEFQNQYQCAMSLCLEVRDLESAITHLTALDYPPPGEILTAPHGREIYAYDPAGNRLILYQPAISH